MNFTLVTLSLGISLGLFFGLSSHRLKKECEDQYNTYYNGVCVETKQSKRTTK